MIRDKIIEVARSQNNTKEVPAGSNKTKYGAWYGMNGVPWCAIFVSWVYDQAGVSLGRVDSAKGFHYCRSAYNYWRSTGELTTQPQIGDIVLFDWDGDGLSDHTGIFLRWMDDAKTLFESWEGNTSVGNDSDGGQVMRRERPIEVVWAFVSPNVLGTTSPHIIDLELKKGDRGAKVSEVQKKLYDLKYTIVVDGFFGNETEKQIKLFQKEHHLEVTGLVDSIVMGALEAELAQLKASIKKLSTGSYIRKGNSGMIVVLIQKALNKKGTQPQLAVDGVFGNAVLKAVKSFQSAQNLKADGVVGPKTFKALGIQ